MVKDLVEFFERDMFIAAIARQQAIAAIGEQSFSSIIHAEVTGAFCWKRMVFGIVPRKSHCTTARFAASMRKMRAPRLIPDPEKEVRGTRGESCCVFVPGSGRRAVI